MNYSVTDTCLKGNVQIPASKSDGQRSVLAAALANGESILENLGSSNDELAMLRNAQEIGANVEKGELNRINITGTSFFPSNLTLNIGESGLGLRLMIGICAVFDGRHFITGDGSILPRSQHFVEENLPQTGVCVNSNNGYLPIQLNGKINQKEIRVDGSQSSQYISGLLMGLPLLEHTTRLVVEGLTSIPYVEMTLETLQKFGIIIYHEDFRTFQILGNQLYNPTIYRVEGDWSSASYWLVASAIGHKVSVSGLDAKSKQADKKILEAFLEANCVVNWNDGKLMIDGSQRTSFRFDATHCPDLFPALVTLATFCSGTSIIVGVNRLINKESNRGIVLQAEFAKIGVHIDLIGDEMHILGGGELLSAEVSSHNDHRIAMCLAIVGTKINGGLIIGNSESVNKSYPSFWEDLEMLIQ